MAQNINHFGTRALLTSSRVFDSASCRNFGFTRRTHIPNGTEIASAYAGCLDAIGLQTDFEDVH